MTKKGQSWKESTLISKELLYDRRLVDRRIEDGFLKGEDRDKFLKSVPEETEIDFTSHEALMAEETGTPNPSIDAAH